MDYDAITIDAQVVQTNSFDFDGGLLAQLKQFQGGPTQVILTNVVASEILKHLRENTQSAKDTLEGAYKKAALYGLKDVKDKAFPAGINVRDHTRDRLAKYIKDIGAEVITTDDQPIRDVLSLYFRASPPFSNSGKKKSEFPDAITLLTLERWAKAKDQKILAVSGDGDWLAFNSEYVTVVSDLGAALALLQEGSEKASAVVENILADISAEKRPELLAQIEEKLSNAIPDYPIDADGNSAYHFESDGTVLTLKSFLLPDDNSDFSLVQVGSHKLVAQVRLNVTVDAQADFSLAVWDSIDREYVPMGTTSAAIEDVELEIETLITFEGDFQNGEIEVSEVEIISQGDTIDFENIEPDYSEEPYEEYEPEEESDAGPSDTDDKDN